MTIARCVLLLAAISLQAGLAMAGDLTEDVQQILKEIRQDRPVPQLAYISRAQSMNPGCIYLRGQLGAIGVSVETHPDSTRVASVLLEIPGPDRSAELLPVVSQIIGAPHSSDRKHSTYFWDWPKHRAGSLHHAPGGPGQGLTIISLFYR